MAALAAVGEGPGVERHSDPEEDSELERDPSAKEPTIETAETTDSETGKTRGETSESDENWEPQRTRAPATVTLNSSPTREGSARADQPGERAAGAPTIVPQNWLYTGSRKPDIVLIENRKLTDKKDTEEESVHFVDVTASDVGILNSQSDKK